MIDKLEPRNIVIAEVVMTISRSKGQTEIPLAEQIKRTITKKLAMENAKFAIHMKRRY